MVPNKGRGENIRTNNWTERGVLRLTEPVVDGSLPSGDFHRWKPLRSRWIVVVPRRIAAPSRPRTMDLPLTGEGNQKILSHVSFPGEGGTSHSLRIAESRSSIVECVCLPSNPCHTGRKGVSLPTDVLP